jgi:aspartate-semialdehyde dehydrogenase
MSQIEVGILGATGMVGQQFIALLANHPWFKVAWLGASQRSEGKAYRDAAAWRLPTPAPADVSGLIVEHAAPGRAPKLVFSGLDAGVAGEIEGAFAAAGHFIVSNSKNYRMDAHVPLVIPEVNADHLKLLEGQGAARGWKGRIVTNETVQTIVLSMALAPLRQSGLKTAMITTLQAISGAGYPASRLDILGNVIHSSTARKRRFRPRRRRFWAASAAAGSSRTRWSSARRRPGCRCTTATPNRSP